MTSIDGRVNKLEAYNHESVHNILNALNSVNNKVSILVALQQHPVKLPDPPK